MTTAVRDAVAAIEDIRAGLVEKGISRSAVQTKKRGNRTYYYAVTSLGRGNLKWGSSLTSGQAARMEADHLRYKAYIYLGIQAKNIAAGMPKALRGVKKR